MVIGSFHRWLLQLPARWRGRARLPRGQLRRETVSRLHYTGVQAAGVRFLLFLLLEDGGPQLEREKQLCKYYIVYCVL